MRTLSETDASYLAGILEGEGTISLRSHAQSPYRGPWVSVVSTDKELIDWIMETCGIGSVVTRRRAEGHKQIWDWRVKNVQAVDLLRQVLPWMRIARKRARAEHILLYPGLTNRNGSYSEDQKAAKFFWEDNFPAA